jgi:hypothetical protein
VFGCDDVSPLQGQQVFHVSEIDGHNTRAAERSGPKVSNVTQIFRPNAFVEPNGKAVAVRVRIGKSDDLLQALLKAGRQRVAENVA